VGADKHLAGTKASCCDAWWDSLTPLQRMWLHTHLWDLEILAGWTSQVMVQTVAKRHGLSMGRYATSPAGSYWYSVNLAITACHSEERRDVESQRNKEILPFAHNDIHQFQVDLVLVYS